MEQFCLRDHLPVQIFRRKGIVCPGIMQKYPVNSRNRKHHRVRGRGLCRDDHILFRLICSQHIKHDLSEGIISDLSDQRYIITQNLHCKTGICHRPSCMYIHSIHMQQPARLKNLSHIPHSAVSRENRCNIQTDMPCHNHFSSCFHTLLLFCSHP